MNQNQELSQKELIELLQNTAGQLNTILAQLITQSQENLPSRVLVENLIKDTQALAESLAITTSAESISSKILQPQELVEDFLFDEEIDGGEPTEPVPKQGWRLGFTGIWTVLSATLQKMRSQWVLIGLIAILVVGGVGVSMWWIPQISKQIGEKPSSVATSETITNPPELESPANPQPVEFAPPPAPELTPEQSLIAGIQKEVEELTRQYPEGLIQSVEANFLASELTVIMGDDWYSLTPSRQNSLANGILERSRRLDFRKLTLTNQQGNLIARSPVVGNEMVILESGEVSRFKIP